MPYNPACLQCAMGNTYPDGDSFVCASCTYQWPQLAGGAAANDGDEQRLVNSANGTVLVGVHHQVEHRRNAGSSMLKACFLPRE